MVSRQWASGAGLNDSTATLRRPGETAKKDIGDLGWAGAIETFRPFLSYNELGQTFDEGPTEFHDRLSRILGLGDIEDAQQLLKNARLARQKQADEPKTRLAPLLAQLDALDDPRALAAANALRPKSPDLDAAGSDPRRRHDGRRQHRRTQPAPLPGEPFARPTRPQSAASPTTSTPSPRARGAIASTPTGEARDIVEILSIAVRHFDTHGEGDCPVCGKKLALLPSWRARTVDKIRDLTEKAARGRRGRPRSARAPPTGRDRDSPPARPPPGRRRPDRPRRRGR